LSIFSTSRGTKLKVKTPATTLTKIAFPQIICNVKETCDACKKKTCDIGKKRHFITKLS